MVEITVVHYDTLTVGCNLERLVVVVPCDIETLVSYQCICSAKLMNLADCEA